MLKSNLDGLYSSKNLYLQRLDKEFSKLGGSGKSLLGFFPEEAD